MEKATIKLKLIHQIRHFINVAKYLFTLNLIIMENEKSLLEEKFYVEELEERLEMSAAAPDPTRNDACVGWAINF